MEMVKYYDTRSKLKNNSVNSLSNLRASPDAIKTPDQTPL
jgi:hypothetical protein